MAKSRKKIPTISDYFRQVYPYKDVDRRVNAGGYVLLRLPRHPMCRDGWVFEHRAVMEQKLGRFLYPCEMVHHRDKDRAHNRRSNLRLFATRHDHILIEHGQTARLSQEVVDAVLKAAPDPKVALTSLPCSPATARKILRNFGVPWVSAAEVVVPSETELKEALAKGLTKKDLPKHFGVSYGTLWRRYPYILVTRERPCFLDEHLSEVCRLLIRDKSFRAIAKVFGTSPTQLSASLVRWKAAGVLPRSVVRNVNARPKCKLVL